MNFQFKKKTEQKYKNDKKSEIVEQISCIAIDKILLQYYYTLKNTYENVLGSTPMKKG